MRWTLRLAAALGVLVTALGTGAASGAAAPADGGLGLALRSGQTDYRAGDQVRLDLTVTNTTGSACALATGPVGTVQITGYAGTGATSSRRWPAASSRTGSAPPPPPGSPLWSRERPPPD
ncbi:hypothetical protein V2I01_21600 [Micromonospora sp. BRA006-A]|nr:hypothetical protein [Micromonospora sp. BRA006-A]